MIDAFGVTLFTHQITNGNTLVIPMLIDTGRYVKDFLPCAYRETVCRNKVKEWKKQCPNVRLGIDGNPIIH